MKRHDEESSDLDFSQEDTQCFVVCPCGNELSVSNFRMFRCEKCGRGYHTEFIVWSYEADERKDGLREPDEWQRDLENAKKTAKKFRDSLNA